MSMDTSLRAAARHAAMHPDCAEAQAALVCERRRAGLDFSLERSPPSDHTDLEQLDCLSEPLDYAFNLLCAWRHRPTGRIFFGRDSGCSCPSPWENDWFQFDGERIDTSLTEVTRSSMHALTSAVDGFPASYKERMDFAHKVRGALPDDGADW